jgi:hypothetical protein
MFERAGFAVANTAGDEIVRYDLIPQPTTTKELQ